MSRILFLLTLTYMRKDFLLLAISPNKTLSAVNTMEEPYQNLHPALKSIFGNITCPPDDGTTLKRSIEESNNRLFVASDASHKEGRSTNAWIFSTGKISDISNPWLNIHDSGPVHGSSQHLSSTRGELQGITSITIILRLLSTTCKAPCTVSAICDNTEVIHKCSYGSFISLHSH
jgi:hypothetical protein